MWEEGSDGSFSVSSNCRILNCRWIPNGLIERYDSAMEKVWKMEVPYKIKVFGWRCFINRLPTRDLLVSRGINSISTINCMYCGINPESSLHSLLECCSSVLVWKDIAE